jgi:drug/metabolite transporter (DMT)-like permease
MKVKFIYLFVVLIWTTTPLAIKWSNESFGFILAVTLRMTVALIICASILVLIKSKLFQEARDWKAYAVGSFGFFPNMVLVYWSAQYIPSGLLADLLGIYPFFVGVLSIYMLRENPFNIPRVIALIVAIVGLGFINLGGLALGPDAILGVLGMIASTFLFAVSTVGMKKVGGGVDPLRQLTGSLLFSVPLFILTWLIVGAEVPQAVTLRASLAIAYLIIAGSILGGVAFFFIVKHCSVSTVSLVPLITPVFSLFVGWQLNSEALNLVSIIGSVCILLSLAIYQGVWKHIPYRPYKLLGKKALS